MCVCIVGLIGCVLCMVVIVLLVFIVVVFFLLCVVVGFWLYIVLFFYVYYLVQCMYYFDEVVLGCYYCVDVFVGYWDFVDDVCVFLVFDVLCCFCLIVGGEVVFGFGMVYCLVCVVVV